MAFTANVDDILGSIHLPTYVDFSTSDHSGIDLSGIDPSSTPRPSYEPNYNFSPYPPYEIPLDDVLKFYITTADRIRFRVAEFEHSGIDFSNHEPCAPAVAPQPVENSAVMLSSQEPCAAPVAPQPAAETTAVMSANNAAVEVNTTSKGRGSRAPRGGKLKSPASTKPKGVAKNLRDGVSRGGKRKAISRKRQRSEIIDLTQDDDMSAPTPAEAALQGSRQASSTPGSETTTTSAAATVPTLPPLPTHDPSTHHDNDASDLFLKQQMATGRTPLDDQRDKKLKDAIKMANWRGRKAKEKDICA